MDVTFRVHVYGTLQVISEMITATAATRVAATTAAITRATATVAASYGTLQVTLQMSGSLSSFGARHSG